MTDKQKFDEGNIAATKFRQEFKKGLSKEDFEKEDAVDKAAEILKSASVPFWLFWDSQYTDGTPYYSRKNWIYDPYDKNGNLTKGGQEFINNHMSSLMAAIRQLLFETCNHSEVEPTEENMYKVFHNFCVGYWRSIEPNLKNETP